MSTATTDTVKSVETPNLRGRRPLSTTQVPDTVHKLLRRYRVDVDEMAECKQFAAKIQKIYRYVERSSYLSKLPPEEAEAKAREDHALGKAAEWHVYHMCQKYIFDTDLQKPCMKIFDENERRFGPDMTSSLFDVHVKSWRHETGISPSGVFAFGPPEKKGSIEVNPLPAPNDVQVFSPRGTRSTDWVVFVSTGARGDGIHYWCQIQAIMQLRTLHEMNLFQRMKNEKLTNKRAVYLDSIYEWFIDGIDPRVVGDLTVYFKKREG